MINARVFFEIPYLSGLQASIVIQIPNIALDDIICKNICTAMGLEYYSWEPA